MKWKVPYIDLNLQFKNLEEEITSEFKRVMSEGSFILRDDVKRFEDNIASYLDVKHVIGVNSGTDALYLAVNASGIKEGDEVITVAHSFVATLASIYHRNAKPVLVDINDDFNIDADKIEESITEKTKAIIPVHLNGRMCNMEKISDIAGKYNLLMIEDSAQSLGAMYKGKKSGSFGILGCFSTHPMKTLSCGGDGGFISTNNDELAEKIQMMRNHGQDKDKNPGFFAYNSRLDNLHAAILNVKFKNLGKWIKRRREIASIYSEKLKRLPLIPPPKPSDGDYFDVYNSYVIRSNQRDKLFSYLREKGIEVFVHIGKPLYKYEGLNIKDVFLPKNEKICSEILSIPIYPEMTNNQVDYVSENINSFFKRLK